MHANNKCFTSTVLMDNAEAPVLKPPVLPINIRLMCQEVKELQCRASTMAAKEEYFIAPLHYSD